MVSKLVSIVAVMSACLSSASAQGDLASRINAIVVRPEYKHASFGVEVYSLKQKKVLYGLNQDKLFVPGSVTKLVTEGTALQLLGADYRFHTRIYRTGPVRDGVLQGDLVLVASGDPNLSDRVRDDKLLFENEDHAYGQSLEAKLVPGDPLQVVHELAAQVAGHGVRKISGRVLVDVSLFPEGAKEGGSGVVISPIAINDNVIDVVVTPGKAAGEAATARPNISTRYATFGSEVKTGAAGSESNIDFVPKQDSDGNFTVSVVGTIAADSAPRPSPFIVPRPSRFAETVLTEALQQAGVQVAASNPALADWKAIASSYHPENQIAEHVSAPLKEDVKVTLKVSQNLHASMMPYLLGALLSKNTSEVLDGGFAQEKKFLESANLDLNAATQSDGAGSGAYFTPDFIVRFLNHMAGQKDFQTFHDALPILGRDGSLWNIQRDSPAAGKFYAKTGTYVSGDLLNQQYFLNGKGLAGYLDVPSGDRLIVAIFLNNAHAGDSMRSVLKIGDALGEIATTAYNAQ